MSRRGSGFSGPQIIYQMVIVKAQSRKSQRDFSPKSLGRMCYHLRSTWRLNLGIHHKSHHGTAERPLQAHRRLGAGGMATVLGFDTMLKVRRAIKVLKQGPRHQRKIAAAF